MTKPTALRVLRILNGNTLLDEAKAISIPKTALAEAEAAGAISDRSRRLILRRHPTYNLPRLLQRLDVSALHVPQLPRTEVVQ